MYYHFLVLVLLALFLFLIAFIVLWKLIKGPPFVPTSKDKIKIAFKMAGLNKNDVLVDVGSGDGAVLTEASLWGCKKVIGYEVNKKLINISKEQIKNLGIKNVFVHRKNFWNVNLKEADVLFVFGVYHIMPFLKRKIFKEMKKGSRVVSYMFKFPGWDIKERRGDVYLYIVD